MNILLSQAAITVANLSKCYRIFERPSDRIKEALNSRGKSRHRDFWSLKDISFEVPRGRTVGIVGANGSGKSTLLKIIAGTLRATSGEVTVNGRVSAILELGTGFHPEFTGRANVLFSSSVSGIPEEEMRARLPEIEAFAEIGEFIDEPVKTYSSGMFVRLAFATAINVDPEILIVDEALAVGDAMFQRKCYERICALQEKGCTILLVSHSLEAIINHCDEAILLDHGHLVERGDPRSVLDRYVFGDDDTHQVSPDLPVESELSEQKLPIDVCEMLAEFKGVDRCPTRPFYNVGESLGGNGQAKLVDFRILGGGDGGPLPTGTTVEVLVMFRVCGAVLNLKYGNSLRTAGGVYIYGINSDMRGEAIDSYQCGPFVVFRHRLCLCLGAGIYDMDCGAYRNVDGRTVRFAVRLGLIRFEIIAAQHFSGLADLFAAPLSGVAAEPFVINPIAHI